MKKRLVFLFLLVMFLILIFGNSFQAKSDVLRDNTKIDKLVYEKLSQKEKVKVIVRLYDAPEGGITLSASKREETLNTLSSLGKNKFKLIYKAKSVNSFTAEISAAALEELKKDSSVEYIKVEPEIKMLLQDSAPLINATLVWPLQVSSVNITGEGQTVCIIDSGINYTHPDLGGCLGMDCRVLGGYAFYNPFNVSNETDVLDDNGHGTHVAGIVGANGTIIGIAPGVKFVALKACGPSPSCDSQAVIDSINWCVGNASLYNISVISMSLGGGLFSTYCDDLDNDTTNAIDAATAKNITVVVATGNDGSTTSISFPACIRNSTAVGGTTKSDAMYSSGNRNNITAILAPGVSINSTARDGTYVTDTGTSMSTPHVSGAVALLKQYKKLIKNDNLTTNQIKDTLNRTGNIIADAASGLNFSRLNVYNALLDIRGYNVSGCTNITKAGKYILNASITNWGGQGACINITVSEVEVDCNGFLIEGNSTNFTYGIKSGLQNSTKLTDILVKNCNLNNWDSGIYYFYTENSSLSNITASNNSYAGVFLRSSSNNALSNINASVNTIDGIYSESSSNNTIRGIEASANFYGIEFFESQNNTIDNLNATRNGISGLYLLTNCSYNNFTNINSSQNDYAGIESHDFSSRNYFSRINLSLNLAGMEITETSYTIIDSIQVLSHSFYGIQLITNSNYNIISNSTIYNNTPTALFFDNSSHNKIVSVVFASNGEVIETYDSYNNTITNITSQNNSGCDINASNGGIMVNTKMSSYSLDNVTLTVKNQSYADLNLPNISQSGSNFSADVILLYNSAFINSSNAPGLNRGANITFYRLSFTNPRILRDNVVCPPPICSIIAYNASNGTLIFWVSGFSAYSAEETPSVPVSIGGGGGGGGGGLRGETYCLGNLVQLSNATVQISDKIKFTLNNTNHTLSFNAISKDLINIMITSRAITKIIYINKTDEIDLDSDGVNDITVTYENYTRIKGVSYASLTINPLLVVSHAPQGAVCGNGIIESGENCGSCNADVKCNSDEECKNATCVKKNAAPPTLPAFKISMKQALFIVSLTLGLFVVFTIVFIISKRRQNIALKRGDVHELMEFIIESIQKKNFELVKEYYSQLRQAYDELPEEDKKAVYNKLLKLEKEIEVLEKKGYF